MVAAISFVAPQRLLTTGACAREMLPLDHFALSLETITLTSEMMLMNSHARTLDRASGGSDSLPCSSHGPPVLRNDVIFDIAVLL